MLRLQQACDGTEFEVQFDVRVVITGLLQGDGESSRNVMQFGNGGVSARGFDAECDLTFGRSAHSAERRRMTQLANRISSGRY